jgi:hypothetical protein
LRRLRGACGLQLRPHLLPFRGGNRAVMIEVVAVESRERLRLELLQRQ